MVGFILTTADCFPPTLSREASELQQLQQAFGKLEIEYQTKNRERTANPDQAIDKELADIALRMALISEEISKIGSAV